MRTSRRIATFASLCFWSERGTECSANSAAFVAKGKPKRGVGDPCHLAIISGTCCSSSPS